MKNCVDNYKRSIDDIPVAVFFLNIARYVQEHIENASYFKSRPPEENISFLNYRNSLSELAERAEKNSPDYGLVHREMIASHFSWI